MFDWFKTKPKPIVTYTTVPDKHASDILTASVLSDCLGSLHETSRAWVLPIQTAAREADLSDVLRLAAFLAQIGHESGRFTEIEENLNYSAPRLLHTFGKYFTSETAKIYERNPKDIANIAYGGRMGNGPASTGDGWRFRGRGLIQLTGRSNYRDCGKALGLDLENNPDLLLDPMVAARSAGWFWTERRLNPLADAGDMKTLTLRINGGMNGYDDRLALYYRTLTVLNSLT